MTRRAKRKLRAKRLMRYSLLGCHFALASAVCAGMYVPKPLDPPNFPKNPTGGIIHWGETNYSAYGGDTASYGASQLDGEYVDCAGTITTVWVWKRDQIPDPQNPGQSVDDPLDNPPEFVISKEYCRAYASAASLGGVLVAADNGLGFDAVPGGDGITIWLTSEGTLYTKR